MKGQITFKLAIAAMVIGIFVNGTGEAGRPENKPASKKDRLGSLPPTAEILFISNRDTGTRRSEIYAMDADGENVTRLTYTTEHHMITGIDPSRRYIVTTRAVRDTHKPIGLGGEDRKSLWVLDLETKKEKRLTNLRYYAEGDSFSPDGEWIVFFMKLSDDDQIDIYKIRRDGSDLTRLTDTLMALEGDPAWSNDGTQIAFTCLDATDENPRFILKTMDVNGGGIQTVYDGGPGVSIPGAWPPGNYDPSWSPDDQWIVFQRAMEDTGGNAGSGIWHIFKVQPDGEGIVDLSLAGNHIDKAEYLPSYSPDGMSIVFGSIYEAVDPEDSHVDIFTMDSDGGLLQQLTDHPANDMYPVWMPLGN